MKHLVVAALLAALPLGVNAEQITFQGLGGTASRQDVLKTFPTAKHARALCLDDNETTTKTGEGEVACDSLELDPYQVGDTSFVAKFIFRTDGRLTTVMLVYKWIYIEGELAIDSKFSYFENLLKIKYGSPIGNPPCDNTEYGAQMLSRCAVWLGRRDHGHDTSEGKIELTAGGFKNDTEDHYRDASLYISYEFVPTDAAGRL